MNRLSSISSLIKSRWVRAVILLVLTGWTGWSVLPRFVVLPSGLFQAPELGVSYVAANGTPLRLFLTSTGQRVLPDVALDKVPQDFVNATLAAEDRRFFQHGGVDLVAIFRALVSNIRAGRVTSGASTITQQLIKISSPRRARSWAVKLHEALAARRLEMMWSKDRILATYLNRVGYGNLMTGCAVAAEGYFSKPVGDLMTAECAFLAALPQAPGRLNPFRDKDAVLVRQRWVLGRMKDLGMIGGEAFEVARHEGIRLDRYRGGFSAPHAVELLARAGATPSAIVRTTIDAPLQRRVESIIVNRLDGLRSRHVEHAACVVIENATGCVRSLVGSRDYFSAEGGQINGAWVPHSPGSALKPLTYALAFEQGRNGASIVPDLPVSYQSATGLYRPENYDHRYYGPMPYREALGNSLNVSAVRVLQAAGGPGRLLDLLNKLHFTTFDQSADYYGMGLTIGNAPVRLIELVNAYATIARMGAWKPWRLRQDMPDDSESGVIDPIACFFVADILSDNQARVLTFGTRSPLRLSFPVAAKTGTSTNYRDNWTVGFTPEYTVGVWAGNFEGQPMEDVSGVTGAAPIFRDVFEFINERQKQSWFKTPSGVEWVQIDPRNGKRLPSGGLAVRMSRRECVRATSLPALATERDYVPESGSALLPSIYAAWTKSKDNRFGDLVTVGGGSAVGAWQILSPTDGMVIRLDPDVRRGDVLHLTTNAPGPVKWSCSSLTIVPGEGGADATAVLGKGDHQLTAVFGEQVKMVRIRVE